MKAHYLPNGKVHYFPDDWTDEQIFATVAKWDPREYTPDRSATETVTDPLVAGGATFLDTAAGAIDVADPDAAPTINDPNTLAGRVELMARDIPVIGGSVRTAGRINEMLQSGKASVLEALPGLRDKFGVTALDRALGQEDLSPDLRAAAADARDESQERRDAENARRLAAGEQSLEDENKGRFSTAAANVARDYADAALDYRSDETKADERGISQGFDNGLIAGAANMVTSPLDTLNAFGPQVAAFLVGGGIFGRGVKMAGARAVGNDVKLMGAVDEAAALMSTQAQGLAASEMNATGARDTVLSLSDEELLKAPMARELIAEDRTLPEVRDIMARRAYDAALSISTPTNIALMGASNRLGANVADRAVAGAKPSFGGTLSNMGGVSGRAARAGVGAAKEFGSEAVEGISDQWSQNMGEIAGGVRAPGDALEGLPKAGIMEGIIGSGPGAVAGGLTAQRVADVRTRVPTDLQDPGGQGEADSRAIFETALAGGFDNAPPPATPPAAAPAPVSMMDPGATTAPDPMSPPAPTQSAPLPAAPVAPAVETAEASTGNQPAFTPVDDLEAQLAGARPVIRPGASAESAAAFGAAEAAAAAGQQVPVSQSRRRGMPPIPAAKTAPAEPPLPPPATSPRSVSGADLPRPGPVATGYAAGVPKLEPGAEAKPYLKANIDTLPDPTPEQLPTDSSARYFDPGPGDAVVPMSALVPTKVEEAGNAAIKRMAATAAGVIDRRAPIDVRLTEDGRYEILDGNGSYAAAMKIGLKDMPVRIVEAPAGKEGWRMSRGMLAPESDASLTSLYEAAAAELPAYTQTVNDLAKRLGGKPMVAPLKGRTRAEQKLSEEYKGDTSRLLDLVRGTIVFETEADALAAMAEITGSMDIVRNKDGLSPGTKDKGFGYRDINIVVQMPGGTKAEIQLMTRAMQEAKKQGHKYYEVTRVLQQKMEDGVATPAEKARYDAAAEEQVKLYTAASPRALATPASNSSRVTGDQPLNGSVGSSTASPDTTRASPNALNRMPVAATPGENTTTANNSSSRSKNNTPLPAGGTATPSNTSDTSESSSGDRDIVQDSPVRRAVGALMSKLGIQPDKMVVLRNIKDLPRSVPRANLDAGTEGIFYDGKVYLFTDNISTPSRAIWVAMHEFGGHFGLRALLPPDQLAKILDAAADNPTVRRIAEAIQREGGRGDQPFSVYVEEALAEMAASYFTGDQDTLQRNYGGARPILERLIKAIKRFMFNNGAAMTDAEVVQLIKDAGTMARAAGRGDAPVNAAPGTGTLQSRSPVNPEIEYEVSGDGSVSVLEGIDELRAMLAERGITDKGKLAKGRLTFTVNQSPRILATISGETNAASRAGAVYDHIIKDGKIVGAPPKFSTEADLPVLREAIEKLAIEGETGRFWYENSGRAVLDMVGGNKEDARKFVQLIAIYSPQADIAPNFVFALRAWLQIKSGKPVNVKTGTQDRTAEAVVRDGRPWKGEKTNNFYNNLMRSIDPANYGAEVQGVTGDMWMARAFQYETDAPNDSQYRFIEIETNRLAQKLGWEPQHAQAAIWVALKTRFNSPVFKELNRKIDAESMAAGDLKLGPKKTRIFSKPNGEVNHRNRWMADAMKRDLTETALQTGEYNYSSAMRDYLGQISWEARPGRTAGGQMQWINDAPMEVQVAYQEEIHQALLGRDGEDILASEIGLPVVDYAAAPGVWQGEVAAGGQTIITLPLRKGVKDYAKDLKDREAAGEEISDADRNMVDPDAQNMVTAYAAILGRLLRQEGMGWHRPDYATSKRDANGVEIVAGRVLTGEEVLRFSGELDTRARERGGSVDDFAIISTPDGLRVLNFGSVQNPVFHEMIRGAATRAIDADIEVEWFRSDGNLITNDWKEDPDGQNYLRAATEAGHRSAAEWADRVLAPRVQAASRAFAERYGQAAAADQRAEEEVTPALQSRAPSPVPGIPTPLYVSRSVLDDGGLRRWAEAAGLTDVLPMSEMHVTVTYSRAPVDVADAPATGGEISAPALGRPIKLRSALAMPVTSPKLLSGHQRYRAAGASHDYGDSYTPHVTLKYDATEDEVATLQAAAPFAGSIKLGPEEQAVLKPGDEKPEIDLDDDQIFDLISESGLTVDAMLDAEKAWSDGDLVFINNEMSDGEPYLAASLQQIRNTTADRMLVVPRRAYDEMFGDAPAAPMQSRAPKPQTETKEFKKWFGKSKVVNADGTPMVVYHGTRKLFNSFKLSRKDIGIHLGSAAQAGNERFVGVNFRDDGSLSENDQRRLDYFSGGKDFRPNIIPVHIRIENPLRVEDQFGEPEDAIDTIHNAGGISDFVADKLRSMIRRNQHPDETAKIYRAIESALRENGYDGLVYENKMEPDSVVTRRDGKKVQTYKDSYVVLSPNQIKSAIGNSGDYKRKSDNIMQSRAATQAARQTAADLRQRKSQLAKELTTQFTTAEQLKSWLGRARLLIGEVSVSPDFAQDLKDARKDLAPERRDALSGDRAALKRYDEIRDMMALVDEQQRTVRAKAAEANRLLDKAERRTGSMSLVDREQLVAQLSESLDAAESAYIAAKRIADWRAGNDGKIVKAHQKRNETLGFLAAEGYLQGSFLWEGAQSLKDKAASIRRRIRRVMQDKLIDMRDVQREIEAQLGRSLDDLQNVYRTENQMHGKVADGIERFRQRMVEPLKAAIAASGMTVSEVERYLWAKHAKERNDKIFSIRPDKPAGSGMTSDEAARVLAGYTAEQRVKLDGISNRVAAIRRHSLSTLVQAGQLSQQQADTILGAYEHYVPLRGKDGEGESRVGGTGQGISAGATGIQRALGRNSPPKNILAELVGDGERAIVQAGKAEVGRSLLRLVLSYPNPDLWSIEPVILEPKFSEATGEVYLAMGTPDDAESIVVKHNGQPYRVQLKHPLLVAALRNTGTEGSEFVVRYLGKITRWLSAVFTRYNPGFVPVNLARDILQGAAGIAAELGTDSLIAVTKNYRHAMAATYRDARSQRGDASVADADKTMADWVREFSEAGGKTGWIALENVDTLQADIENSMMSLVEVAKSRPLDVLGEAFSRSKTLQFIDNVNDAVENAIRVATYAHLRKDKGWSREKAADYAKEMTVNFNRKGTHGSVINALYLFYNAGVQGSRRTLMLMKHPKVQVLLGSLATGQMILAATMGMIRFDDEDEETLWDKIPDHVKRRSFVIPTGFDDDGTARWISIPMPFGFNVFPALGGYAANYFSPSWVGKQESPVADLAGFLTSTVIDALSPVAVGEEGAMWPTAVKIGMNMASNRDDLGRRIRPSEDFSTYEAPRSAQFSPGTATPFMWAAKALNRIGGGSDYRKPELLPSVLDVSPNDLEFLFNQFAGGPGTTVTGFLRAMTREVATGDAKAFDLPIIRSVVGGARSESTEARRFYEGKDRIERNLDRLKDAYVSGGEEGYYALVDELGPAYSDIELKRRKKTTDNGYAGDVMADKNTQRPELTAPNGSMLKTYRTTSRDVRDIASEMRRVYNDTTLSTVERQRRLIELQRERGETVKALNRLMTSSDADRARDGD